MARNTEIMRKENWVLSPVWFCCLPSAQETHGCPLLARNPFYLRIFQNLFRLTVKHLFNGVRICSYLRSCRPVPLPLFLVCGCKRDYFHTPGSLKTMERTPPALSAAFLPPTTHSCFFLMLPLGRHHTLNEAYSEALGSGPGSMGEGISVSAGAQIPSTYIICNPRSGDIETEVLQNKLA